MASIASTSTSNGVRELAQKATQANKEHQYTLKVYSERLESELEALDKLLAAADVSDHEDELEINAGGTVVVRDSIKLDNYVLSNELSAQSSPFYADAMRRQRYINATTAHPMRAHELEALTEAVRSENRRIHALQAQFHGYQPFQIDNDPSTEFLSQNKIGIDWERVATKVSTSKSADVQRSAKECEIRWLGDRHPQFNHVQWSQAEITRVRELVAGLSEGQVDWVEIATQLGTGRTPIDCMRHAIIRKTHSWDDQADQRLLAAVKIYGTDNWSLVARAVSEDVTPAQCQNRWLRTIDPSIKRGAWTEDEDNVLRRAVAVFGHSWMEVAAFVPGRNNEQCRDRYNESLHPSVLKGKWTEEEDTALLETVQKIGENKWKEVSQSLSSGRTDNTCRNRYYTIMKRKAATATASPAPASGSCDQPKKRGHRKSSVVMTDSASASDVAASPAPEAAPKARPRPRPRKMPVPAVEPPKESASTSQSQPEESISASGERGDANAQAPAEVSQIEVTSQAEEGEPLRADAGAESSVRKSGRGAGKGVTKRARTAQSQAQSVAAPDSEAVPLRPTKRRKTASGPLESNAQDETSDQNGGPPPHEVSAESAGSAEHAEGEDEEAEPGSSSIAAGEASNATTSGSGKAKAARRSATSRATNAVTQPGSQPPETSQEGDTGPATKSSGRRGRKPAPASRVQPVRKQPARGKTKDNNGSQMTTGDNSVIPTS